jgi:hypothetical protein
VFFKVLDQLTEAPVRIRRTIALPQTPKRQAKREARFVERRSQRS